MNENAKKWVEALRSGNYDQTKHYLARTVTGKYGGEKVAPGFCCLGVACDLFIKENPDQLKADNEQEPGLTVYTSENGASYDRSVLPVIVRDWLGLNSATGHWNPDELHLAQRNDDNATFDEIADIIESEPVGLFVDQKD